MERLRKALNVGLAAAAGMMLGLALVGPVPTGAQQSPAPAISNFQSQTVTNGAAVSCTATDPAITDMIVTIETASIRWRADGANPSTTVGHLAQPGSVLTYHGHINVARFAAIATSATNALMQCSVMRP